MSRKGSKRRSIVRRARKLKKDLREKSLKAWKDSGKRRDSGQG